ncbi:otopetrin-2-like isoform X2 [Zootermopsis nevadensis]|nr:otopetrin-2-like isoform X2 [Zootermopsis nevadensis]XP_021931661.1 otopetrin-2-like isoform X2 [Zootermopsis nevadensis]XP_021931662.1 otopetrin-2-like isoform X2 [Zootermopsis nevadensis]
MQRCPYIHEMKERLLSSQGSNPEQQLLEGMDKDVLEIHGDPTVGTVVKLNPDGYGSHTSPTHHCTRQHLSDDYDEEPFLPKNAKTSLFIIMSFIYAKLLVVICIAYVISEVVTHKLPLHYYEGFFTYLYGTSILFLLYVFCFLLQESACCTAAESTPAPPRPPPLPPVDKKKSKEKEKEKEKDKGKEKKAGAQEQQEQQPQGQAARNKGNVFQREVYPRKMKDLLKLKQQLEQNSGLVQAKGVLRNLRSSKDVNLNDGAGGDSPSQEKLTGSDSQDLESGRPQNAPRKRKTSQNVHSHGSFFLRVGAIAFGLGTMIYNGLECGAFFEIPFTSPCYQILRGINPVLQMIFTFMQMYFIFMNSRLNIHRFKILARFGLMHIVATNLCVWIRTLVLESIKEITNNENRKYLSAVISTTATTTTATLLPDRHLGSGSPTEAENIASLLPQALTSNVTMDSVPACGRVNIMGSIVQDSAPYLFPFIIEYSLIGAAVIYVMWRHIGRSPRYLTEEDLEHRLEVMLSRRAVAMAHAQQHGRVDCVGASKGLFFGLLLLVGSLICLILFFVLIHHPELGTLAIYLADVSHCVLMALSIMAIIVGFIRVQSLKFRAEEQSDLNDILLRVSAFGLFVYAVFSVIAGSLAFTHEPNLLVMITGLLSVVQVVLQLLFIADVGRRRVHLPEHDRSKPGRQVVTFLLICNVTMWVIYTFEAQKVIANPVQLDFYGFLAWVIVQRVTLPLCIFHRFHSAVTLAEIWKTSYKARLE